MMAMTTSNSINVKALVFADLTRVRMRLEYALSNKLAIRGQVGKSAARRNPRPRGPRPNSRLRLSTFHRFEGVQAKRCALNIGRGNDWLPGISQLIKRHSWVFPFSAARTRNALR